VVVLLVAGSVNCQDEQFHWEWTFVHRTTVSGLHGRLSFGLQFIFPLAVISVLANCLVDMFYIISRALLQ